MIGEQTPKKKKVNNDKDRRILRIVENHHLYEDDGLLTLICRRVLCEIFMLLIFLMINGFLTILIVHYKLY